MTAELYRPGTVFFLNKPIENIVDSNRWLTGYYRIKYITDYPNSKTKFYHFQKMTKDRKRVFKFVNGYNTDAWHQKILEGQIGVVMIPIEQTEGV